MEIKIDEDIIIKAVASVIGDGLKSGVESWKVREEVGKVAGDVIIASNFPTLIHDELKARLVAEAPAIVKQLVDSVMPALQAAFARSFQASLVAMVYGVSTGKPSYMNDTDVARWKSAEQSLKEKL